MPAAIALGTSTFTMSALPGTPGDPERHSDAVLRHHPFAAPGLGMIASAIMLPSACGGSTAAAPRRAARGEGFGGQSGRARGTVADDEALRERATTASEFDPAEIRTAAQRQEPPIFAVAVLPLVIVVARQPADDRMVVLPRLDTAFLAEEQLGRDLVRFGSAASGRWSSRCSQPSSR
jgi:hypothetical protein